MSWKYASIDIETLGLDYNNCDIIEFSAVLDDLETPLDELPIYHRYLVKENNLYQGEAMAIAMHSEIMAMIAKRADAYRYISHDLLDEDFSLWVKDMGIGELVIAGKNFAKFDLRFLEKIGFGNKTKFNRRIVDVGSIFYNPIEQDYPPNLEQCLKMAGINKSVSHSATQDALDVIKCLRYKYLRN